MAIIAVPTLISEEADWSNGKHQVRRVYSVKADSALEAQVAALAEASPATLTKLSATTRYADAKTSSTRFHVEITYGRATVTDIRKQEEQGNPLDWDPKISYPAETTEQTYFKDTEGTKVLNSARQPFDTSPTRLKSRMIIQVVLNIAETDFHPFELARYADTLNASSVTVDGVSYPTRSLLMTAPQASEKQKHVVDATTTIEYRTITFQLLIDPTTGSQWTTQVADAGYDELIDGKWVPIVDDHGQKVTKAFPLDGEGRKSSDPATLVFLPYFTGTWGSSDLG